MPSSWASFTCTELASTNHVAVADGVVGGVVVVGRRVVVVIGPSQMGGGSSTSHWGRAWAGPAVRVVAPIAVAASAEASNSRRDRWRDMCRLLRSWRRSTGARLAVDLHE